jgi:hypothetical protein
MLRLVKELLEVQEEISQLREKELKLRGQITDQVLFSRDVPRTEKTVTGDYEVTVTISEKLEILDKNALIDLCLSDKLSYAERDALRLKPDITVPRAQKLDEESEILNHIAFSVSPTPTVKVKKIS